ncbi:phytanoyl-CoA dioxygenase family protein [Novosphingobium rosa]|uniref:phytanoyl-CoA dioxygenase family protein n=1 Tax=Novosphingobium rosa TaxID=76978 RepID=UPI00082D283B|nr:phytanoyl-CoA dioxygenase family protein [Novosphingobium rosa]
MARIERRLADPLHHRAARTPRAALFQARDHHAEPGALPPGLLAAMRDEVMQQHLYHDPTIPGWTYRGLVEAAPYSELHMLPHALFASDLFLEICTSPTVMTFCREVIGPRAAVSWGQAWIANPGYLESPKWKWHRNNDEPFNAVQVLVPLGDVLGEEDGPMLVLPGSAQWSACLEPRLYGEDEVEAMTSRHPPHALLGRMGDVAFFKGFALHRLTPVLRRQAMLAILVSIGPALGSPTIMRRPLSAVPGHLRERIAQNEGFFRRLVC